MVKQNTLVTHIGGRGGTHDALYLSGYKTVAIAATLTKLDAGSSGQVIAAHLILKPYLGPQVYTHDDLATSLYEFPASDIGSAITHEGVSGANVNLTDAVSLVPNNEGAVRYAGSHAMLSLNKSANDGASGKSPLRASENAGQSWSWEAWVFRNSSAAQTELYLETNNSVSSFIQILLNTNGTISVSRTNGGGGWTSPVGSPLALGAWSHVMLVYSSGGTQQLFINGVSAGAATASVRGAAYTVTSPFTIINRLVNNIIFITQIYTYQNVLMSSDDALRRYNELSIDTVTGAIVATSASINQAAGASVLFSNTARPTFDTSATALTLPLTPFVGIVTNGGVFLAEVTTYRED